MNNNMNRVFLRITIVSFFITLLAACGGGGSDGPAAGSGAGSTGTASLSWTPPTTYTDDTALTDLAGYKIYYGNESASYDNVVSLTNPGLSSYVVESLAAGTYYFVITAINDAGVESAYSNEESLAVN